VTSEPTAPVADLRLVEAALRDAGIRQALREVIRDFVHRDLLGPWAESDLFGRNGDSFDIDFLAWLAAGISSSRYATRRMGRAPRLPDSRALLLHAVRKTEISGLFLEFGVYSGATINVIAAERSDWRIFGFDSFEGLPENWRPGFEKGAFKTDTLPHVAPNVELIVGCFDRTLPTFLDRFPGEPVAFVHVDCDLYSSTQCIFSQIGDRIKPGTVILFDEYFNYPGWELHEFKAFQEFIAHTGLAYRYIGVVSSHQQVAVEIIG
jgi:hypothetical protein